MAHEPKTTQSKLVRVLGATVQSHASFSPITVVSLRLPNFVHSGAYDDLADSVRFALQRQGNEVRLAFGVAGIGPRTLLFGAHLLRHVPNGAEAIQSDTIIVNTEHTSSHSFNELYLSLLSGHEVWDYSADNAAALTAKIGRFVRHVPFGYVPELSRIIPAADEDIDVLFYGSINVRRQTTLDRLAGAGLNVKAAFGVYGAERDALIARSKLVLNVHFYEPGHFEIVRVGYLLANRKAVITEANPGEVVDTDLVPGLAAVSYNALPQTVLDLLSDVPRRRALGEAGFTAFAARDAGAIVGAALTASWSGEPASTSA
jgi:hypothetical protein